MKKRTLEITKLQIFATSPGKGEGGGVGSEDIWTAEEKIATETTPSDRGGWGCANLIHSR